MEFDITIERIDNGYIFSGKGITKGKHYYKDLETFAMLNLVEEFKEIDKQIREHDIPAEPFKLKIESDL